MTTAFALTDFADDPIASHSAQFPLARPLGVVGDDLPSPDGVRPWNLRALHVAPENASLRPIGSYDHDRQVTITADGTTLVGGKKGDQQEATADSVSDNDGDEGRAEDWTYDFAGDFPVQPA